LALVALLERNNIYTSRPARAIARVNNWHMGVRMQKKKKTLGNLKGKIHINGT